MTSPVDTSVKFIHSYMAGAPVMSGTVGAMIAALDACLINGFALKSVDSLVIAGNVATLNIATGHPFEVDTVAFIAGATPASLNGEQKIVSVTANSATFATVGLADQTATGAITVKVAPAGWLKPFSGTNLAVYQSADPSSTQNYLRVDDTTTTHARVRGYETMSDVNSGTGPFPPPAWRVDGQFWMKSNAANTNVKDWVFFGDGKMFYFGVSYTNDFRLYQLGVFGDPVAFRVGDPFVCCIFGNPTVNTAAPGAGEQFTHTSTNATHLYMARASTNLGSAISAIRSLASIGTEGMLASGLVGPAYPNAVDGGLYITPFYISEHLTKTVRGVAAGLYGIPMWIPTGTFTSLDKITGVLGLPGKNLRILQSYYTTQLTNSTFCVDMTGPWR